MEYEITIEQRDAQPAAVVRGRMSVEALPAFLGDAFTEVLKVLEEQHLAPAGPPFGIYRMVEVGFDVAAGFPCTADVTAAGRVEPVTLPGGPAATTMHVGAYDGIAAAYAAVTDWLAGSGYVPSWDPWESYLDDPDVAEPRTVICFPCQLVPVSV